MVHHASNETGWRQADAISHDRSHEAANACWPTHCKTHLGAMQLHVYTAEQHDLTPCQARVFQVKAICKAI